MIVTKAREAIKANNIDGLKALIFQGEFDINEPVDSFSCHTALHDTIIMNLKEMFDFVMTQEPNLNLRDQNGVTSCTPNFTLVQLH